jgi:hypothetical protein
MSTGFHASYFFVWWEIMASSTSLTKFSILCRHNSVSSMHVQLLVSLLSLSRKAQSSMLFALFYFPWFVDYLFSFCTITMSMCFHKFLELFLIVVFFSYVVLYLLHLWRYLIEKLNKGYCYSYDSYAIMNRFKDTASVSWWGNCS